MASCCPGHGHWPLLLGVLMAVTLFGSYLLAVYLGHVSPLFPYISDTGADQPESSLFSEFLNIVATLALFIMYLRYKLIREITQDFDRPVTRLAKTNLGLGFISCFGLSLVANFQENDTFHANIFHFAGAFFVYAFGVAYTLIDTIISCKMCPAYNGSYICKVRLCFVLVSFAAASSMTAAGIIASQQRTAGWIPFDDRQHWSKDDGGYVAHVISTFSEWLCSLCFILYFLTYIKDYRRFTVDVKLRVIVSHLDEVPFQEPSESTRLLV